jgi:hypothetical protein
MTHAHGQKGAAQRHMPQDTQSVPYSNKGMLPDGTVKRTKALWQRRCQVSNLCHHWRLCYALPVAASISYWHTSISSICVIWMMPCRKLLLAPIIDTRTQTKAHIHTPIQSFLAKLEHVSSPWGAPMPYHFAASARRVLNEFAAPYARYCV